MLLLERFPRTGRLSRSYYSRKFLFRIWLFGQLGEKICAACGYLRGKNLREAGGKQGSAAGQSVSLLRKLVGILFQRSWRVSPRCLRQAGTKIRRRLCQTVEPMGSLLCTECKKIPRHQMMSGNLVREMRLELTRLLPHAPQTCLSTYSSTLAFPMPDYYNHPQAVCQPAFFQNASFCLFCPIQFSCETRQFLL